jgi:hypothetical protein
MLVMKKTGYGHLGYNYIVFLVKTIASEELAAMICTVSKPVRP